MYYRRIFILWLLSSLGCFCWLLGILELVRKLVACRAPE